MSYFKYMAFYYFPPQYGSLAGDFKVVYKPTMKLKEEEEDAEEAAEEEKDGGWRLAGRTNWS